MEKDVKDSVCKGATRIDEPDGSHVWQACNCRQCCEVRSGISDSEEATYAASKSPGATKGTCAPPALTGGSTAGTRADSATVGTCAGGAFVLSFPYRTRQDTTAPTPTVGSAGGAFVTSWKVNSNDMIEFTTTGTFTIDWGDGRVEQVNTQQGEVDLKHTYVKKGEYTVAISSGVTSFRLDWENTEKLIEIKQWGRAQWENMGLMFDGARSMICTATDTPDLSKVKNMAYMFRDCWKFNSPIEHWDTKGVIYMDAMLCGARMFNRSLAKMDLKAIEEVGLMLKDTPAFDQDLRDFIPEVDTDKLFGLNKSLADYNEKYAAQDEKKEILQVFN